MSLANQVWLYYCSLGWFWSIRFGVTIVSIGNNCNVKPDWPEHTYCPMKMLDTTGSWWIPENIGCLPLAMGISIENRMPSISSRLMTSDNIRYAMFSEVYRLLLMFNDSHSAHDTLNHGGYFVYASFCRQNWLQSDYCERKLSVFENESAVNDLQAWYLNALAKIGMSSDF